MAIVIAVLVVSLLAWLLAAASGIGAGSDARTESPRLAARLPEAHGPVRLTGR